MSQRPVRKNTRSFFEALSCLPDTRDNRGKHHESSFVLCGVSLAIMAGRIQVSGIHRFMDNRFRWLRRVTRFPVKSTISLSQLYRFIETVDWEALNALMYEHFKFNREEFSHEWNAVDGKALRGSPGQQIISVRGHQSKMILAQKRVEGKKKSEITEVRSFFKEYGLWSRKSTLDAAHLNPVTTSGIHQHSGGYVIQAKANQPQLLEALLSVTETRSHVGSIETVDKAHGRLETRRATFFSLSSVDFDKRWDNSGLRFLIVMNRSTKNLKTGKVTQETSYYVTNQAPQTLEEREELFWAIRHHWGVESDHWIRDVTFGEDRVKASLSNRTQVLALLRTLALYIFRREKVKNMKAKLELFADSPTQFKRFLKQVNFL